jgi:hypothetical protein
MHNLAGLAIVADAVSQPLSQLHFLINGFQKYCPAIRTTIGLVKKCKNGLGRKFGK